MIRQKETLKIMLLLCAWLAFAKVYSQETDMFRTEYTYFPQRNSDNSFRRFRTMIQVPLKVGKGIFIIPFFEYRNVHLIVKDDLPFTTLNSDRYESYEGSMGYTFPMNNNWRFGARAGGVLASNFQNGKAQKEDLFAAASFYFIKDVEEPLDGKAWRLILGVQYANTAGRPFPLPYINYYKEFTPDWSYSIGLPKMNLKYRFNERHNMQAYASLDGFFGNLQDDIPTNDGIADNISMTTAMTGLGYEYCFTTRLSLYAYAGYTIFNDIRLRDDGRNNVKTINRDNSFYSRIGIKFKI